MLAAIAGLVFVLFAGLSIWLGFPRTDEYQFQHALRVGMTKSQVMDLWRDSGEESEPTEFGLPKNTLGFAFDEREIICHGEGSQINVQFDNHMQVQSWRAQRWKRPCL